MNHEPRTDNGFTMLFAVLIAALFQQPVSGARFDLSGLATIELPSEFKPVGRGQDGPRTGNFDPATLGQHRNDYQITFRLEQGQHSLPGGALANPVLLHVTLFNPAKAKPDPTRIGFTTIAQFYPRAGNDRARLDAHFEAQRWLDDEVTGDAVTRVAATNEGRGDSASNRPPERWLVIHVDPTRRVRVDLYALRTMYSLDDARALVRRAAESVRTTPKLAELFGGLAGAASPEDTKLETTLGSALTALSQCGIRSMGPGMVAFSDRCAAWLSDDRRSLRVARAVGRVPVAAAKGGGRSVPELQVEMPPNRSAAIVGPSAFRVAQLFWHDAVKGWVIGGFGDPLYNDDAHDPPLITAITPYLRDRKTIYLVALASYDLTLSPDRTTIAEFLTESDRVASALRDGTVISGVHATPFVFRQ
jgi:hypothetical protein